MLIDGPSLTDSDRENWKKYARTDVLRAMSRDFARQELRAKRAILDFLALGPAYLGVSWGKDSVVIAGLAMEVSPNVPLVWVRVKPIENPDCAAVRDAFLKQYPSCNYDEIEVWCRKDADGWHATGTLEAGFKAAQQRYGIRHISGVRAQESRIRAMRTGVHGENSANTSAPIARWSGDDVFAYLHKQDLPVHPAYAASHGGLAGRTRIRVASIGGKRGDGMGRAQWEQEVYHNQILDLADGKLPEMR